jgi:hypothetical protein
MNQIILLLIIGCYLSSLQLSSLFSPLRAVHVLSLNCHYYLLRDAIDDVLKLSIHVLKNCGLQFIPNIYGGA